MSGTPPTWSTLSRAVTFSKRRGDDGDGDLQFVTAVHRAKEHVVGCSREGEDHVPDAVPRVTSSRSQLAPRTGRFAELPFDGSGSLSRKPTGRRPSSGRSRRRLAINCPTLPDPMISVGLASALARLLRSPASTKPLFQARAASC